MTYMGVIHSLTNFCWMSVIIFNCLNKNEITYDFLIYGLTYIMCAQMEGGTIWEINIKAPTSHA